MITAPDLLNKIGFSQSTTLLGFSKLLISVSSSELVSQDLRHCEGLFLFQRGMNDASFRRQKAKFGDILLANNENLYGTALLATLRGVKTMILPNTPSTVPFLQRVALDFLDGVFNRGLSVYRGLNQPVYRGVKAAKVRELEAKTAEDGGVEGAGAPPPAGAEQQAAAGGAAGGDQHVDTDLSKVRPTWKTMEELVADAENCVYPPLLRNSLLTVGISWMAAGGEKKK